MHHLFVTGAARSGTTLFDKLLSSHPRAVVLSQPLPLLYVRLKEMFLEESRHPRSGFAYPLNDMFLDNYYTPERFADFLRARSLDVEFVRATLGRMADYDGQYTKPADPYFVLDAFQSCRLAGFVARYCEGLALRNDVEVVGAKESFCEEFIPYYLDEGTHVVQLMRDPRDVLASLTYGSGAAYSGSPKPHLFNIRQWRKSAAFALALEGRDKFHLLRYEDLVVDPVGSLQRITDDLGLASFSTESFGRALRSLNGEVWISNSSHRPTSNLTRDSVGIFSSRLPAVVRRLIEACCFYEMRALGYQAELGEEEIPGILRDYTEADALLRRPELSDYGWSLDRVREEVARVEAIQQGRYDAHMFLFSRAFEIVSGRKERQVQ
jgi:hypothetical protein